jgi:manganese transport protein
MADRVEIQDITGWRQKGASPSLADVFRTIPVTPNSSFLRRLFAFMGPGFLVAVGYMDPGNWATSIAGGAQFGYALLFVALLSNVMAILLQSLCARLAIGSGRDLAQACRDAYPKSVSFVLWIFAEIAIIATDVAEVVGTAIGLNLLFGIPLEIGVIITACDVFVILLLQKLGFRWIEAFVLALLAVIFACFWVQIAMAKPEWAGVIAGFAPTRDIINNPQMLYLALGIIGATVMPHNLYLHSGIVQTRAFGSSTAEKRSALWLATTDSTFALMLALLVNAGILVLAAATFNKAGQTSVTDIGDAHKMLAPLVGSLLAPKLFAIALLACGLNSTVTATLAGQIVMEGFLNIRLAAWARRLLTRAVAIIPAVVVIFWYGAEGTGKLLIFSQVVLAFQLPFAVVPLVLFTANRAKLGDLTSPRWLTLLCSLVAALIIALNIKLLWDIGRSLI